MDVRIRQARNEVLSRAVDDNPVGRHRYRISASHRRNAISPDQHGLILFNALVV